MNVLDREQAFFASVEEKLVALEQITHTDEEELVYSACLNAFKQGLAALQELQNQQEPVFYALTMTAQGRLPSMVFQASLQRNIIQLAGMSLQFYHQIGTYDPNDVNAFFDRISLFAVDGSSKSHPSSEQGFLTPIVTGAIGYFVGRNGSKVEEQRA